MRRFAGFLLLLLFASSGAHATAIPRVSDSIRIEYSFLCRETSEVPPAPVRSTGYPSARPAWYSHEASQIRAGIERALYQRPPPAAL
jgi:hypothetical protein